MSNGSLRQLLAVAVCLTALSSVAGAQRRTVMTIPLRSIVQGTAVNCSVSIAPITAAAGRTALDTTIVAVVSDSNPDTPVDSPVELTLLVDDQPLRTTSHSDTLASAPTSGATSHAYAVRARGIETPICVAGGGPTPAVDTLVKRVTEEQRVRLARTALVGDSWVILSLIKSVSGRIPTNEFFDLRLKFGGEVLPLGPSRRERDSTAVARAKRMAVDRIRAAGGDSAKLRVAVPNRRLLAQARTFEDSAEAADWGRDVSFQLRHLTLAHTAGRVHGWVAGSRLFTMANIDLNLNTTPDTSKSDSTNTSQKQPEITDAGFSVNYITSPVARSDRMGFAYGAFKVFNAKSYYGAGYGGLELRGSRLEGTMVTVSYLHRMYRDSTALTQKTSTGTDTTVTRELANTHNLFVEFFIRVPDVQILANLRIRGGVLYSLGRVPAGAVRPKPESRISISVPIVDLQRF